MLPLESPAAVGKSPRYSLVVAADLRVSGCGQNSQCGIFAVPPRWTTGYFDSEADPRFFSVILRKLARAKEPLRQRPGEENLQTVRASFFARCADHGYESELVTTHHCVLHLWCKGATPTQGNKRSVQQYERTAKASAIRRSIEVAQQ